MFARFLPGRLAPLLTLLSAPRFWSLIKTSVFFNWRRRISSIDSIHLLPLNFSHRLIVNTRHDGEESLDSLCRLCGMSGFVHVSLSSPTSPRSDETDRLRRWGVSGESPYVENSYSRD